MSPKLEAALIRAARTAAQAFIGYIGARWIGVVVGDPTVTGLIDVVRTQADAAGGAAIVSGLAALGMNLRKPIAPEAKS